MPHSTSHIPHPTSNTPHSQHPSPPAKYLCLSSAPAVQSVLLTSTPHGFCVDLWHLREKYSCAAWHIPNPIFHLPHPTSNIQHITFHIPHSQHSSPKSTRFFPSRPAPRPNTPFSAHHCNRLTTSHLSSKPSRATFQTHHSPPRNAIFRPSIPALSRLHPLPFASRYLSYRNSKHAQRRVLRSASSVQTDLFRPIQPATPTISPKNPTQVFHQKSLEC